MSRTKRVKIFLQGEIIFMEMVRGSRRNIPSGVIFLSDVSLNGIYFFHCLEEVEEIMNSCIRSPRYSNTMFHL